MTESGRSSSSRSGDKITTAQEREERRKYLRELKKVGNFRMMDSVCLSCHMGDTQQK
jgi:hypothetical protein